MKSPKTDRAQEAFMELYQNRKLEKVFTEKISAHFPFETISGQWGRKQTPSPEDGEIICPLKNGL